MRCSCQTAADNADLYYDLVKAGTMSVVSVTKGDYEETVMLKCTACGTNWKYHYTDSYHSPIVTWKKK